MRRDPEDVYKSKPDWEMPLFDYGHSKHSECASMCVFCSGMCSLEYRHAGAHLCTTHAGREEAHARHSDPETSKKAAASVTNLGRTKDRILQILRNVGPMTDEQIAAYFERFVDFKVSPSGLRTRRSWLVDNGLVVDSGQVGKTASGRPTIIWRLVK